MGKTFSVINGRTSGRRLFRYVKGTALTLAAIAAAAAVYTYAPRMWASFTSDSKRTMIDCKIIKGDMYSAWEGLSKMLQDNNLPDAKKEEIKKSISENMIFAQRSEIKHAVDTLDYEKAHKIIQRNKSIPLLNKEIKSTLEAAVNEIHPDKLMLKAQGTNIEARIKFMATAQKGYDYLKTVRPDITENIIDMNLDLILNDYKDIIAQGNNFNPISYKKAMPMEQIKQLADYTRSRKESNAEKDLSVNIKKLESIVDFTSRYISAHLYTEKLSDSSLAEQVKSIDAILDLNKSTNKKECTNRILKSAISALDSYVRSKNSISDKEIIDKAIVLVKLNELYDGGAGKDITETFVLIAETPDRDVTIIRKSLELAIFNRYNTQNTEGQEMTSRIAQCYRNLAKSYEPSDAFLMLNTAKAMYRSIGLDSNNSKIEEVDSEIRKLYVKPDEIIENKAKASTERRIIIKKKQNSQ